MISRIVAIATLMLLAACAGTRAKQNILVPQLQATWPEIRFDIERAAPEDALTIEEIDEAEGYIMSGIRVQLRKIYWPDLEAAALSGIEEQLLSGELSEGVAVSLREQLSNFRDILQKLQAVA